MRLRHTPFATALIAALAMSFVWSADPCCGMTGMGTGRASGASVAAVSCCDGAAPSQCQPSIQSTDEASLTASVSAHSAPVLSVHPIHALSAKSCVSRPSAGR